MLSLEGVLTVIYWSGIFVFIAIASYLAIGLALLLLHKIGGKNLTPIVAKDILLVVPAYLMIYAALKVMRLCSVPVFNSTEDSSL